MFSNDIFMNNCSMLLIIYKFLQQKQSNRFIVRKQIKSLNSSLFILRPAQKKLKMYVCIIQLLKRSLVFILIIIFQYGWYWGPLSSEAAEKVLSNEPDGSFIVRDSSDDHYIFSLSFKLNNCVRHVRIEQDQGIIL